MKKKFLIIALQFFTICSFSQSNDQLKALSDVLGLFQKKGKVVFYAPKEPDCELLYIVIIINGQKKFIRKPGEIPVCREADKDTFPVFELPPGNYKFTGGDACGIEYYGNVTIESGRCKLLELHMP